ncbi:hypothetical protein [Mucilaginibacter jinjuensis]|uniref:Uncharacterized protein n=1 Tax=Mucilaginibacter jinjuensis TaxID=1176721 RepID=A0ABY7TCH8_9SPHI|nr:hypothetical protein [Mucilaginibacter jinjuensis]WCT14219.1 hypothetical protein PQO05_09760 [Mucilaginibacter jinjuensis]
MDNQPTLNTPLQNHHKKEWKKPTIEIINEYNIESGNINFGPEGVQFPGTTNTHFRWQQSHS